MFKKKNKTRKQSIVFKQMMLTGAVVWLSICIIVGIITNTRRNDMVEMAIEECISVATLLANYIDIDQVTNINVTQGDCDEYLELQDQLNASMNNGHIKYIYTLWTDRKNVYYGVDGDKEETCAFGEIFGEFKDYEKVFDGEIQSDENYVNYDGEYLISAYIPLLNENGEVEGVLACDFSADDVRAKVLKAWYWLFAWATIGTLLASGSLFLIVKGTVKKILILTDKVDELVSSNGDLTKSIDITSGDEVELLSDSINALMKYIREVVINIAHNSHELEESSQYMLEQTHIAKDKITDISAAMEEMSAGMEETSASLHQINENINDASNAIGVIYGSAKTNSEAAQTTMNEASVVYEDAIHKRNESKEKAKAMAEIVNEKIEQSKAVEHINDLTAEILNIAAQTNLLSLNASIEAAHAGDAGRGFAVVAGEIGKLAKNSSEAAEQIKKVNAEVLTAVNDLAKEAQVMITFMDEIAMQGYEQLLVTSGEYKQNMENVNNTMLEFASQCEVLEQSANQVAEAVDAVNIAVEESTKGITMVTESSVDLNTTITDVYDLATNNSDIAKSLDGEVNKFKY